MNNEQVSVPNRDEAIDKIKAAAFAEFRKDWNVSNGFTVDFMLGKVFDAGVAYASAQPSEGEEKVDGWIDVKDRLPEEREDVVIRFDGADLEMPHEVIGYLRYAAGDKDSPQFITPGVTMYGRKPIAWKPHTPFSPAPDDGERNETD